MGKIRVLESWLAGRIAAGEVVERPASVVKELVENSLDAGARSIEVEIEGGGFELIRVRDDGEGMDAEDANLALQRFATSKVRSPEDLGRILTLGFRGEALPSIAAVSHMEVVTSTGNGEGTRIRAEGGKIILSEPVGAPRGTTVTVRRLFYNTPARKKFLKSAGREAALCLEVVEKFAIAWPEVRFRVIRDGKEIFSLPPAPGKERVARVLGIRPEQLVDIGGGDEKVTLSGFVGVPEVALASRHGQHFCVNRRPVHSPLLSRAVEDGTRTLIFTGHYPICALFLDLLPELVDPNVHPRKLEVKLLDEQRVFSLTVSTVSEAFRSRSSVGAIRVPQVKVSPHTSHSTTGLPLSTPHVMGPLPESSVPEIRTRRLPPLRVLGQVAGSYIAAASPEGLALIDQHAAHERVLYEKLWKRKGKEEYMQILVVPLRLELTPSEAEIVVRMGDALREVGIVLSEFGERTYIIRAVPSIAAQKSPVTLVRACLKELTEFDTTQSLEDLARRLAGITACHSAVKAGDSLPMEQMIALVRDLGDCEDPYTCFHGRPTLIMLTQKKIEEWFLRT